MRKFWKKRCQNPTGALCSGSLKEQVRLDYRRFTLNMINGVLSDQWKNQRMVMLPKPNNPPEVQSSCCPICLTDPMGEIQESLIEYEDSPTPLKLSLASCCLCRSSIQFGEIHIKASACYPYIECILWIGVHSEVIS